MPVRTFFVAMLIAIGTHLLCAATNITVVTWNTHKFMDDTASDAFHAGGRIARALNADVYALQETPNTIGEITNVITLRDNYLTNYYIVRSGMNDNNNRQTVLSRYPVRNFGDAVVNTWTDSGDYINDYTNEFTRELFYAQIDVPGADMLHLYSVHLKATGSSGTDPFFDPFRREVEARHIVAHLDGRWSNQPAQQIVLCGDMNTVVGTPSYGMAVDILTNCATGLRLTEPPVNPDTSSDTTYPTGDLRFDYQLPSPRMADTARSVFRTDAGTPPTGLNASDTPTASDHLPVWYRYQLSAPQIAACERILVTEANLWCSDNNKEFIELYNAGTLPIDLRNWSIDDLDGAATIIASNAAVVLPGHLALIKLGDPSASGSSSAGSGLLQLFVSELSFTGTDDQLLLINTNGHYVDAVAWNNKETSLGSGESGDFNTLTEYMWRAAAITNVTQYNAATVPQSGNQTANGQSLYRLPEDDIYLDRDTTNDWTVVAGAEGTPGEHNPGFVPEPAAAALALLAAALLRHTRIRS